MRGWVPALLAIVVLGVMAPVAHADVINGSSLTGEPNVEKASLVDSVYWLEKLPDGTSAAMTVAGTVRSVTIKGYARLEVSVARKILIQVLRPQPDGSLLIVETSQAWELPNIAGLYAFAPTNMTVQPGDFIGIATLGGAFNFATSAPGAVTNDFSGHEKDMNGDSIRPTKVESGVELLAKVDVKSKQEEEQERSEKYEEEKKKKEEEVKKKLEEELNKPCECQTIELFVDKTLLRKRRVPSNKRTFGVGFTWHLTCTKGRGGCVEFLTFRPPTVIVGRHRHEKPLKLKLDTFTFVCSTACNTSTFGRFEIKMKSRRQLNRIFGKTLAFEIDFSCGPFTFVYLTEVMVDDSGRLHAGHSHLLRQPKHP